MREKAEAEELRNDCCVCGGVGEGGTWLGMLGGADRWQASVQVAVISMAPST